MQIQIRALEQCDVVEADRIIRLAFGTFLGVPDPMKVFGDSDFAITRYRAAPDSVIAAFADGELAGSNFITNWGSFGFFGPLTVHPRLWDHGVAQRLLQATMEFFTKSDSRHTGLFTFSHSPKHAALYQKFDYWPQYLTPVMSKAVAPAVNQNGATLFSELRPAQKQEALADCRKLTDAIFEGLDVSREICAVDVQQLGDAILLFNGSTISAFAVCHTGAGTEAGSGACYVKFAAVRPNAQAQDNFEHLLQLCEAYTASRKATKLIAGVNMARHEAYRTLARKNFRADMMGVAMQKANAPGFNRPGVYVLDDWR
jgi:GNAT superfamily N-acetyltransferase